jgi:flagellar biosynthesis anti-sigma factor FlgM
MKIENNGTSPVPPKRTDGVQPNGKTGPGQPVRSTIAGKDRAEVTESARLLAKARAELDSAEEVENERIQMLKQQIASGNYEIPVDELAKRLLAKRSLFGE